MTSPSTACEVVVVPTGTANLASVLAGLRRAGARPRIVARPDDIEGAPGVVLPGVGALAAGMEQLEREGWVEPLRHRLRAGAPTLCVCLGMQMLGCGSEESPGASGLGIVDAVARRFEEGLRVPHMGFNGVSGVETGCPWPEGNAYFAHSYRFVGAPKGWWWARARHGGEFVAAMGRDGVVACQFHPELSGAWGHAVLEWFVALAAGSLASAAWPRSEALSGVAVRVVPCLDVRDGRVVKGVRFAGLRDAGDPAELAAAYDQQGADELVLLDVSATPEGRRTAAETVRRVRAVLRVPLCVGGGVRCVDDAARLLDAGADKVAVNTAAVEDPSLIEALATRFGTQCTVVAIDAARSDAAGRWEVVVASGRRRTGLDAVEWAARAESLGAGEVLLTSWDRDGTGEGYDLELLRAVRRAVRVPIVASGGASHPRHLVEAVEAGADAVLAASIFHYGRWTVPEVKAKLASAGVEVRS